MWDTMNPPSPAQAARQLWQCACPNFRSIEGVAQVRTQILVFFQVKVTFFEPAASRQLLQGKC